MNDNPCARFDILHIGKFVVILFDCGARVMFGIMLDLPLEWVPYVDTNVHRPPLPTPSASSPLQHSSPPPPCPHVRDFYTAISYWCMDFSGPVQLPCWLIMRGFPDRSCPSLAWTASARLVREPVNAYSSPEACIGMPMRSSVPLPLENANAVLMPSCLGAASIPENSVLLDASANAAHGYDAALPGLRTPDSALRRPGDPWCFYDVDLDQRVGEPADNENDEQGTEGAERTNASKHQRGASIMSLDSIMRNTGC